MKDELSAEILKRFAILRPKIYSYLTDDNDKYKKPKSTKKGVIKQKLKSAHYKNC